MPPGPNFSGSRCPATAAIGVPTLLLVGVGLAGLALVGASIKKEYDERGAEAAGELAGRATIETFGGAIGGGLAAAARALGTGLGTGGSAGLLPAASSAAATPLAAEAAPVAVGTGPSAGAAAALLVYAVGSGGARGGAAETTPAGGGSLRSPKTIRFSQNSTDDVLGNGTPIAKLVARLRANPSYAARIEPIRLVRFRDLPASVRARLRAQRVDEHSVFSLDNRRLLAARLAKVKVNARWATREEIGAEATIRRFTTTNGGRVPEVRTRAR